MQILISYFVSVKCFWDINTTNGSFFPTRSGPTQKEIGNRMAVCVVYRVNGPFPTCKRNQTLTRINLYMENVSFKTTTNILFTIFY